MWAETLEGTWDVQLRQGDVTTAGSCRPFLARMGSLQFRSPYLETWVGLSWKSSSPHSHLARGELRWSLCSRSLFAPSFNISKIFVL